MSAADRGVRAYLSDAEIRALTRRSDLRGAWEVLVTWSIIGATMGVVAYAPSPWTVGAALVVLGSRQLALGVLMHEASHGTLMRTRRLNDFVGHWLCGLPNSLSMRDYWRHHRGHHRLAGTERDPDRSLVAGYPTSRARLARRLGRDIIGLSSLKRLFAITMMGLGKMRYTAAIDAEWLDTSGQSWRETAALGLRNLGPIALVNAIGFAVCWLVGHPWLFALWWAAYMTTHSVFMRLRSFSEHACVRTGAGCDEALQGTRTTLAGPLARFLLAPHFVNYHLEHHLLMAVPCYRLPTMHRLLKERGALDSACVADGYGAVVRDVTVVASPSPA